MCGFIHKYFFLLMALASIIFCTFLLWIWLQFRFAYTDELLTFLIIPPVYAAYLFSYRKYLSLILMESLFALFLILFMTSNLTSSLVLFGVILGVMGVICEFIFQSNRWRRRIEDEIKYKNILLETFIENAPAAIAMLDKNLCYIAYSKRWISDYNLKEEDLIGKNHYDVFPEIQNKYDWKEIHQRCLEGAVERREEDPFRREDGHTEWQRWEVRPWYDPQGEIGGIVILTESISERKRAEEELKKSELMYRNAIEVAGAVPYYQNYLTEQYEFVGEGIKQMTGYSPEEFSPDLWVDMEKEIHLLGDLEGLSLEDAIRRAQSREGISWRADYKIKTRSNETRWLANAAVQVRDESGSVVGSLGIFQDITEQKQAEENLEKSERLYHNAIEVADAVPYYLNFETDSYDFVGDGIERLIGYTKEEFTYEFWLNMAKETLIPDQSKAIPFKQAAHYSAAGEEMSWRADYKVTSKTGETRWLANAAVPVRNEKGQLVGSLGILQDITDRKQAEQALLESEKRLIEAQKIAKIVDFVWDIKTDEIIWSEAVDDVLYYSASEISTMHLQETKLHHSEDRARINKWFEECLSSGKDQLSPNEYRLIRKDGKVIFVRTVGKIQRENGQPVKVFATIQDVTERKRAEDELQRMQKLESIGTLAGGIAHDFNNVLTGVFGNISIAKEELSADQPAYEYLQEAEKSLNRATRLTSQLLTFSKGGMPTLEHTSLHELVREVASFDLTGSNVKPVFSISEDLWLANVDKGQIQQVISNLVINAQQAMPNGGTVYIQLENEHIVENQVPGLQPGRYIKLTVKDEGIGIEPKHRDQIFNPYFTTKQTGSGLGLATSYSIIQKHKGHIALESRVGKGTTFTVYLPVSDSREETVAEIPPHQTYPVDQHTKILVMDDEEMVCNVVERMLMKMGYQVQIAKDGKEAIELYKTAWLANERYEAVIMDLTIPGGMGGKEAVQKILEIDPNANCIVSSGYADDPVMANHEQYGFKGICTKPYSMDELKHALVQATAS